MPADSQKKEDSATASLSDTTSNVKGSRALFTVRQFSLRNPAFPEGGLRYLIFHAEKNGFSRCLRRVGRKVLIDEIEFSRWVDEQNQTGGLDAI